MMKKYTYQAKYFSKEELEKLVFQLIELDEKFKMGYMDLQIGLETIIANV